MTKEMEVGGDTRRVEDYDHKMGDYQISVCGLHFIDPYIKKTNQEKSQYCQSIFTTA